MQKLLTHTANEAGDTRAGSKTPETSRVRTLPDARIHRLANPEASYDELEQTAGTLGIAVSRQAIEQRLTPGSSGDPQSNA